MTDAQLQRYLDRHVEVQFIDGIRAAGRLVEGEPVFARGDAYSIVVEEATVGKAPVFIGLPYASMVRSVKLLA